jgi:peptide/nickel transport system substrate-binding protein
MFDPKKSFVMGRRDVLRLLGGGMGAAVLASMPQRVLAQRQRDTLVIGIDISDIVTLDPARIATYTAPMVMNAAYDTLVTMKPGSMIKIEPRMATAWERLDDGKRWRFTLRQGVKFASGNPVTADDVKFSFERVMNLKDQPAGYIPHVERVAVADPQHFDIYMKQADLPLLTILCAPEFVVCERKALEAAGGTADADAKDKDKAITWLNNNSAGTGAFRIVGWERNAQIQLVRNPNYWGQRPAYERVVIRHIGDGAAQLLAVRRGDIQAAFNLIPEQVAAVKGDSGIRIEALNALDYCYLAIMQETEVNKALAVKECRQAISYAIDYDGIIKNLVGGSAVRPAHFLPIGVLGSTEAVARKVGPREDLAKAKELLAKGGYPNGFEFELAYSNASWVGVPYQALALKLQADLARVGIKANLRPQDQLNMRTDYLGGKFKGAIITYWNPQSVENLNWAEAVVQRVAKRVRWDIPKEVRDATFDIAKLQDPKKAEAEWIKWQEKMVDQANLIVLFQPIYQIAVRDEVAALPLTAAGWVVELDGAKPKA